MERAYGLEVIDELKAMAKEKGFKFTRVWIDTQIEFFRFKIAELGGWPWK